MGSSVMTPGMDRLDKQVRFFCRASLRKLWDDDYGLCEEDVMGTAAMADYIYIDNTDLPATECSDRALDIAFEERDKLYDERI